MQRDGRAASPLALPTARDLALCGVNAVTLDTVDTPVRATVREER